MSSSNSILFVDDDLHVLRSTAEWLGSYGHSVHQAASIQTAVSILNQEKIDIAFVDLRLGSECGMDLLLLMKESFPQIPVVLLSGHASIEDAMQAIRNGAADFLTKPLLDDKILQIIDEQISQKQTVLSDTDTNTNTWASGNAGSSFNFTANSNTGLRFGSKPNSSPFSGIIGSDAVMRPIFEIAEQVADTRTTILLTGESGTGKSLLARAIHRLSSRRSAPFVEVACGTLSETLLESELFGHAAGAFTGAISKKIGRFLQADGGTIFLDEIGTASQAMQIKLLRVLQDFEFEPVGSTQTHRVNTRVILATNEDLPQAVAEGRFRQDLFYRINVISLELPPLRRRRSDIPALAQFFLEKIAAECSRPVQGFMDETLERLQHYAWPGNVRELQNVVERLVLLTRSEWIGAHELPTYILEGKSPISQHRKKPYFTQDFPFPLHSETVETHSRVNSETYPSSKEGSGWNLPQTANRDGIGVSDCASEKISAGISEFNPETLPYVPMESPSENVSRTVSILKNSLSVPERQIILQALEANHWSRTRTAEFLGINRTTLYKKMKKLCLTAPETQHFS